MTASTVHGHVAGYAGCKDMADMFDVEECHACRPVMIRLYMHEATAAECMNKSLRISEAAGCGTGIIVLL